MTTVATGARAGQVVAGGVRWSRRVVVAALGVSLAAALLPTGRHTAFVFVAATAGLIAGLPHGAVDHRLAARLSGHPTAAVAAAYAGGAALTWALLATVGPFVLIPVLALSLVHFALGEVEVMQETTGWRPPRLTTIAVAIAGTGALVLPLARSGPQLVTVAAQVSPFLGPFLGAAPIRLGLIAGWAAAAAIAVVSAGRAGQRGVVVDVLLIGALGSVAPPLVAFAVWFGGWHSLRHCARLLTLDSSSAAHIAAGRPGPAIAALARAALWPSVAAVVVLAGLLTVTLTSADPTAAVAKILLVLLALTVPHMVVVMWLDRRQVPL